MTPSAAPIAAYYLALCGAMGLYLPYLSLYLSSAGLSDAAAVQEIGRASCRERV